MRAGKLAYAGSTSNPNNDQEQAVGVFQTMKKLLCNFRKDERGNIAIIFGLAAIPFMVAAGMAVDYGRAVVAKHKMQSAMDAAVLAAASMSGDPDARKAMGKAVFEANYPPSEYGLNVGNDFIDIQNNVISASETHNVNTTLMKLASKTNPVEQLDYKANATALVPQVGGAEIALVLDYSGSMGNSLDGTAKYITMRNAAKQLVQEVSDNGSNDKVKIAMVPFSSGVRVRLKREHTVYATRRRERQCWYDRWGRRRCGHVYVSELQTPSQTNRTLVCVGDRRINATNDTEPSTDSADWRHRWWIDDIWYDWRYWQNGSWDHGSSSCNSNQQLYELTNQISNITAPGHGYLAAWTPSGGTAISAGFSMGWHAISPNSVLEGGADYSYITHEDPEERIIKAIVLLTDGEQSAGAVRSTADSGVGQHRNVDSYTDSNWLHSPENANRNFSEACEAAKALGIIVMTVAFDLDDQDTVDRLEACASDKTVGSGKLTFNAGSNTELVEAFSEIGNTLTQMVYLSK